MDGSIVMLGVVNFTRYFFLLLKLRSLVRKEKNEIKEK